MTVRPATPVDVPALAGLAARSYAHAFRDILDAAALASRGPGHFAARFAVECERMTVAERDGRTVGFSLVSDGTIDMLFVDPLEAGRGAGTALLRAAEVAGALSLECFRDNGAARAFYESRGWRVMDEYRREFAGSVHDFVLFRPVRTLEAFPFAGSEGKANTSHDGAWPWMHDWRLVAVTVDWRTGVATFVVEMLSAGRAWLIADGLRCLCLPRAEEWGPSDSINTVEGPAMHDQASRKLIIQMHSGDCIEILAEDFRLVREDAGQQRG